MIDKVKIIIHIDEDYEMVWIESRPSFVAASIPHTYGDYCDVNHDCVIPAVAGVLKAIGIDVTITYDKSWRYQE